MEWCSTIANSTPQLQVLSLPRCFLHGPICGSLSVIRSFTEINLQYNSLYGPVPEFFGDLSSLRVLRLTHNALEGRFPTRTFQRRNLTIVDIGYNFNVSGSLPNFSPHSSLTNLLVSSTNFSGPIPSSISNLKSLKRLGLAASDYTHELPSSVGQFISLKSLEVSGAAIIGAIPSWIANLTSLVLLQFSNCGLSGQVPSSIGNLKKLTRLALYRCNFSGQIPPHIFNLTRLKVLHLHSNNFVGTVELSSFWKLPSLFSLNLSNNKLSVVDGEEGNSSWMSTLRLASCNISKLPNALRHMHRVGYLDLSDNQIHGAIPHWAWETWTSLGYLNLSHNKFSSIGHGSLLSGDISIIDLSFNQFKGPLPIPGPDTETFYCSNNRFSSVPLNFRSHLTISYLDASRNNLSGEIPPSICDARSLLLLDLSYNNLSGSIPSCLLEDINSLSVLNLKRNHLHGELPHNVKQGCALEALEEWSSLISGEHWSVWASIVQRMQQRNYARCRVTSFEGEISGHYTVPCCWTGIWCWICGYNCGDMGNPH